MTLAEAHRAIYIDFECLIGKGPVPPKPALLGVVVGDGDTPSLEQVILDERLAPAKVARKTNRVALPSTEVENLLARAAAEGRTIVGWSLFDRDRLKDALPDRAKEIDARYVNALKIARPWRAAIYPTFPIERADEHAPKHTLDKYATLARYPRALKKGDAAKRIRYVQNALKKNDGRYSQMTQKAKREWHALLEYNQHDCLALRHIVLKATRDLECWRAYQRTRFCVDEGSRRICFMAGSTSAKLDAVLRRHQATRWAFLTAWNPASVALSQSENDARQRELIAILDREQYRWLAGEGIGEDPAWTPEKSLFILDISRGKAVALGRQFGQLAVVVGRRGEPALLVSCASAPPPDAGHPTTPAKDTTVRAGGR